ncbi:MAG: CpaD family pilus assembly protein [Asticcacaulis sp.]
MFRPLSLLILSSISVLGLSGCGGNTTLGGPVQNTAAITPGSQHTLRALETSEAVPFAAHANGLSANQKTVLRQYVLRAEEDPSATLEVAIPAGDGNAAAVKAGYAMQAHLLSQGLSAHRIRMITGGTNPAHVLLTYRRVHAEVPRCGQVFENLSSTATNAAPANFGCAVNANLAAQIADPRDIQGPAPFSPADAARRETVLDKYRKGQITASETDAKSSGVVSKAVQ